MGGHSTGPEQGRAGIRVLYDPLAAGDNKLGSVPLGGRRAPRRPNEQPCRTLRTQRDGRPGQASSSISRRLPAVSVHSQEAGAELIACHS